MHHARAAARAQSSMHACEAALARDGRPTGSKEGHSPVQAPVCTPLWLAGSSAPLGTPARQPEGPVRTDGGTGEVRCRAHMCD